DHVRLRRARQHLRELLQLLLGDLAHLRVERHPPRGVLDIHQSRSSPTVVSCSSASSGTGGAPGSSTLRIELDGMWSSSRYFATVRRAMRIPSRARSSESRASESGWAGSSASMSARILFFTARDETSSPPEDAIAEWKKNFMGTSPRGVAIHLLDTTRE